MAWNTGTPCALMTVPHRSRPPCHGKRERLSQLRFVKMTGFGYETEPEKNVNIDHSKRCLYTPEECRIQIGSSGPLQVFGSRRYSKSSESLSGNKSLKVGINWITGICDPCSLRIAIVVSISGLTSGVIMMCWVPVLFMRWATPTAEFLGETTKATHSARMIPNSVVPYVIVSKHVKGPNVNVVKWRRAVGWPHQSWPTEKRWACYHRLVAPEVGIDCGCNAQRGESRGPKRRK